MLTDSELASMQATVEETFNSTCTIQRRTLTSDDMGGHTETWAAVASNVPCSVNPANVQADEGTTADRLTGVQQWLVRVPAGTDVTAQDRVTSGSRTFEVQSVAYSAYETHRTITALEVT